ncbi:MAG: DNA polymerase Y family protein [Planctomycetota bacterium]
MPAPPAFLTTVEERGRQLVVHRCAVAAAAGVAVGMGLAEARALLPGHEVIAETWDALREREALGAMARWAYRFAPLVALDPPDGLWLDVTGCGPLFQGEERLLEALVTGITRHRVAARGAIASTTGCAWARARYGSRAREVVPAGAEGAALAALPLVALRLPADAVEVLEEVGVDDAGRLVALPRTEVAARFPEVVLRRLDQALGHADEPLVAFRPPAVLRVTRTFAGPVRSFEAVRDATRALVEALAAQLETRALGALALEATLTRSDAPPVTIRRALSRRSSDARHLWALLAPAIEDANLGYGVDAIELVAPRTGARRPADAPSFTGDDDVEGPEPERAVAELLDALAGRLGPAQIVRVEAVASHVPEAAFRRVPVLGGPAAGAGGSSAGGAAAGRSAGGPRVVVGPSDRPSLLLAAPEPVEALDDGEGPEEEEEEEEAAADAEGDGPRDRDEVVVPARFRWRGTTFEGVEATGAERIAPRWWEAEAGPFPAGERAYVVATTAEGRRLWMFLETASGRWFVHGEWA